MRVEGRRAAACRKSSGRRKGEGRCQRGGPAKLRRITTTTKKRIASLPPPLPPLLLLPLLPPLAATPAPPLLPLIKQWQQLWQHGVGACGGHLRTRRSSPPLHHPTLIARSLPPSRLLRIITTERRLSCSILAAFRQWTTNLYVPEEFVAEENLNHDKNMSVDEEIESDDETVNTSNVPASR